MEFAAELFGSARGYLIKSKEGGSARKLSPTNVSLQSLRITAIVSMHFISE